MDSTVIVVRRAVFVYGDTVSLCEIDFRVVHVDDIEVDLVLVFLLRVVGRGFITDPIVAHVAVTVVCREIRVFVEIGERVVRALSGHVFDSVGVVSFSACLVTFVLVVVGAVDLGL